MKKWFGTSVCAALAACASVAIGAQTTSSTPPQTGSASCIEQ